MGGGQDGCERRIDVFVKIPKKWGVRGVGLGGQGGCERRIEVFFLFFNGGGVGSGSGGVGLGGLGWM